MLARHIAERVIDLYLNEEEFERWLDLMKKAGLIDYHKKIHKGKKGECKYYFIESKLNGKGGCVTNCVDVYANFVILNLIFFGEYFIYIPDYKEAWDWMKKKFKELKERGKT